MTTFSKTGKRLGRPPGRMTREQELAKHPFDSGSKEKVIDSLVRYATHPDEPMVSPFIAHRLETTRNLDISPNKLFEDEGHRLAAIQYLVARCEHVRLPATEADTYVAMDAFLSWSFENKIPPTIGCWALWNGVTMARMSQIERAGSEDSRSVAFGVCKEALRSFMEHAAWNSALNPLIFFHSQKALYDIVEKTQVTVVVDNNTSEPTAEEMAERVVLLTQGEDGVFRE